MTVAWLERLSNTKNEELDPGLDPIRFFDDAGANELLKKVQQSQTTTDGMNTSPVDMFRQGVEITNTGAVPIASIEVPRALKGGK